MSTEFRAIRKKRMPSDTNSSNPAPEGDHRKRRRNRTTQSCLNCHTSKRMCDRKRPCGRCTQLGLTGLCIYEVDDPSQRSDVQDESSRLRKRVAELEGVIRELKNKPHPRWAKSGSSPGEELEKWHPSTESPSEDSSTESQLQLNSAPLSSTHPKTDSNEAMHPPHLPNEPVQPCYTASSFSPPSLGSSAPCSTATYSPYFDVHSPPSVPSTGVMTPTDECPRMQITVASDQQISSDLNLASMFMTYPDLLACEEAPQHLDRLLRTEPHSHFHDEPCLMKHNHGQIMDGHCGCLNEFPSYNVVLELSLRLRKAVDILSRSTNHHFNDGCPLKQRISDLDVFATNVLGNMTTSPNDLGQLQLPLRPRANTAPSGTIQSTFSTNGYIPSVRIPSVSPQSLRGLRPWDCASAPSACDESFMSWEPPRRG